MPTRPVDRNFSLESAASSASTSLAVQDLADRAGDTRVSQVQASIQDVTQTLGSLRDELSELSNRIGSQRAELQSTYAEQTDIESQLANSKLSPEERQRLQSQLNELSLRQAGLKSSIAWLQGSQDGVVSQINAKTDELDGLKGSGLDQARNADHLKEQRDESDQHLAEQQKADEAAANARDEVSRALAQRQQADRGGSLLLTDEQGR